MLSNGIQTMKHFTHKNLHPSRGVSLVELMVGLAIGLLLALAASSAYMYSKQSFNSTSETAQAEENGRFALNLLTRFIQSSGFAMIDTKSNYPTSALDQRISGCDFGYTDMGGPPNFTCLTAAVTDTFASSSLRVVFETDQSRLGGGDFEGANCIGETANAVVETGVTRTFQTTSYFFVSSTTVKTEYGTTTMGQLSCLPGDTGTGVATGQQQQPLIPGIVQIDFRYVSGAATATTKTFLTAAETANIPIQPGGATGWDIVSAVDVCVMSKTLLVGVNDVGRTYTDCKGNAIAIDPNAIYRTFRTRVNLRNAPL
jgi:type IV pilus assembly protein PilW